MVSYIRNMSVKQKHWLDEDTFNDGVALCQMIPGATAMQTSAYVGLKTRGIIGAAASFIGFGLPAFLLMMTFAALYTYTHHLPLVLSAFSRLQAIIVAIIANATISFGKTTLNNRRLVFISILAAALFGLKLNPIIVILLAAICGLVLIKTESSNNKRVNVQTQNAHSIKPLLGLLAIFIVALSLIYFTNQNLFKLSTLLVKIDLFAFGGGFASVPLMFHEVVEVRKWLDSKVFMDGIVLGQVTPGPIVITATFVGYLIGGVIGGIVASVSMFFPSFFLVVSIAPYFDRLRKSPSFQKVIKGALASFVGLLFTVTIRFALIVHWDFSHILLALLALVTLLKKVDILWVILIGTILSVMMFI